MLCKHCLAVARTQTRLELSQENHLSQTQCGHVFKKRLKFGTVTCQTVLSPLCKCSCLYFYVQRCNRISWVKQNEVLMKCMGPTCTLWQANLKAAEHKDFRRGLALEMIFLVVYFHVAQKHLSSMSKARQFSPCREGWEYIYISCS